jgi:hypothetical protein
MRRVEGLSHLKPFERTPFEWVQGAGFIPFEFVY